MGCMEYVRDRTRWLTMMSTWHGRFRLAVQFPKKSSHLRSAGSKAEGLGSVRGHPRTVLARWGRGQAALGPSAWAGVRWPHQVKGSVSAQS